MHSDLNLGNILVAEGRITGLIDAENLGVGDRAIDVASLGLEWLRLCRTGTAGLAADGLGILPALGREVTGGPAGGQPSATN